MEGETKFFSLWGETCNLVLKNSRGKNYNLVLKKSRGRNIQEDNIVPLKEKNVDSYLTQTF